MVSDWKSPGPVWEKFHERIAELREVDVDANPRRTEEQDTSRRRGHLELLSSAWIEFQPTEKARLRALRLLRVHPLRAAHAL